MAIAALILGLCSLVLFWLFGIVPILAIVLGGIALSRTGKQGRPGKGMALAGVILGTLGVIGFVILMIVVSMEEDDEDAGRGPVVTTAPTSPSETINVPRPTSSISLDQIFTPISGYTFGTAPSSVTEDLRESLEDDPALRAFIVEYGARAVRQDGRTIGGVYAITFAESFADSATGQGFVAGAASEYASHQPVTVAGEEAEFASDPDGNNAIIVFKNGVGLVVAGPTSRSTLEQVTSRVLANIP